MALGLGFPFEKPVSFKESRVYRQKDFGQVKNLMTHNRSYKLLCPSRDKLSPKHSPHF